MQSLQVTWCRFLVRSFHAHCLPHAVYMPVDSRCIHGEFLGFIGAAPMVNIGVGM